MDSWMLSSAVEGGAEGLVMACTGDGTLPRNLAQAEQELNRRGIPVVRSSRVWATYVSPKSGCLSAGLFNAQKARIVLQLALRVYGQPLLIELSAALQDFANNAQSHRKVIETCSVGSECFTVINIMLTVNSRPGSMLKTLEQSSDSTSEKRSTYDATYKGREQSSVEELYSYRRLTDIHSIPHTGYRS